MSSVFNDSEGLYRTTVCRCLVRRPHYFARLMRFGSRGPSEFFSQIRHRNAFTEIVWEDAVALEKNRELLHGIVVYRRRVTKSDISACCCYFEGTTFRKSQILIPSKKPDFRYGKN